MKRAPEMRAMAIIRRREERYHGGIAQATRVSLHLPSRINMARRLDA